MEPQGAPGSLELSTVSEHVAGLIKTDTGAVISPFDPQPRRALGPEAGGVKASFASFVPVALEGALRRVSAPPDNSSDSDYDLHGTQRL